SSLRVVSISILGFIQILLEYSPIVSLRRCHRQAMLTFLCADKSRPPESTHNAYVVNFFHAVLILQMGDDLGGGKVYDDNAAKHGLVRHGQVPERSFFPAKV